MSTTGPAPVSPVPISEALDNINAMALSYAKKWNLVCENGEIVCLRPGCGLAATLPSLLCAGHLATHRRGYR